jgi:hypothetical protein
LIDMRLDLNFLVAAVLLLVVPTHAVRADMGPCRKLATGGIMCGEGNNAALVINGTISPSKRLAFAWRQPDDLPKFDPGDVELMLVRLDDGAVLAQLKGEYWETADGGRANRMDEWAAWSADSRLAVEIFNNRWDATITLYPIGADDAVGKPIDLVKPIEQAAIAKFPAWGKSKLADHALRAAEGTRFKKDGTLVVPVMLYIPKQDPTLKLDVTLAITRKDNAVDIKVRSVQRANWDG